MENKYTIWTLNQTETLLQNAEWDLNWIFGFNKWEFGKRKYNNIETSNLMPDEEYFVPISVKCIGCKFEEYTLDSEIQQILKNINNYNKSKGQKEYKKFWTEGCGPENSSKMLSEDFIGYYEMLEKNGSSNNILIGYSQGGLVARYLAWLDEYVFKKNIIKGIITVSSPNFGSPLANHSNRNNVIDGIIDIIYAFFSLYEDYFGDLIKWTEKEISFDHVFFVLNEMLKGVLLIPDSQISKKTKDGMIDFLAAAIKWLGGLKGDVDNAFYDLNILNLNYIENNYSVLYLVNKAEYNLNRIFYGGIISCDNDFDSVIISLIEDFICILIKPMINNIFKSIKILDKSLITNLSKASVIYCEKVMKEIISEELILNPQIIECINSYNNGNARYGLIIQAHDFVIPSAYQLLLDNGKTNFLGNRINKYANHNSGKSIKFKGGRENYKWIMDILKKMK